MTSLPVIRPAPELPAGPRAALVVAIGRYTDAALTRLGSTARDAAEMAGVLADPDIGSFQVTSVVDRTAQEVRLAMQDFLESRGRDELVVVYLSCHGLLDRQDRLYFAATDTRKDRLAATGVEAAWLSDRLEECRATCQVVILDCCNSGAFGHAGGKGDRDTDLHLPERFVTQGRGRAVLTASRAYQRSWEGEAIGEVTGPSVFTSALVEGLRTGAADLDGDGYVSAEEAYQYAYRKVMASGIGQVPQHSVSTGEGTLLLARNPVGRTIIPAPMTEDLRAALDSPHPAVRLGAVNALGNLLTDSDPAKALGAEQALRRIAANEVFIVASAARTYLKDLEAAEPEGRESAEPTVAEPEAAEPEGRESAEPTVAEAAGAAAGPADPPPGAADISAGAANIHAARTTSPTRSAGMLSAAGFGILLIIFCIDVVTILQRNGTSGPRWAIIAAGALGIVVTLGGVRKNSVPAVILLSNLAWAMVYELSYVGPSYSSYRTISTVLVTVCVIGAVGNAGLCIWILALRAKGRDVNPFLAIFAGCLSVAYILAAVAWAPFPVINWPVWKAVGAVLIVGVLVGLLALLRVLRGDASTVEHDSTISVGKQS
jgi:Caspase domain